MFEYLSANPEKADQFSKAMEFYAKNMPGFSESFLVNGYDWKSLRAGTLVDVGGSNGYVSKALADAFPELNIILEDLGEVIDANNFATHGEVAANARIKYLAYDFFTPQPVIADAYLFRWVFLDWPDHYVVRIIRNLVPALRRGARVIVNESLSPDSSLMSLSTKRNVW
jgi:hypothetical protein